MDSARIVRPSRFESPTEESYHQSDQYQQDSGDDTGAGERKWQRNDSENDSKTDEYR